MSVWSIGIMGKKMPPAQDKVPASVVFFSKKSVSFGLLCSHISRREVCRQVEWETLYRTGYLPVYRYLWRLSGDAQLAEELASETLLRAAQAMDHFRGDCDLRVWLCQIGKNLYYSYRKKHKKLLSLEEAGAEHIWDPAASVEEQLLDWDMAKCIQRQMQQLPEPYQTVFLHRAISGLSFGEIGKLFGKTDNWACVTYHRARKKIMEQLKEETI